MQYISKPIYTILTTGWNSAKSFLNQWVQRVAPRLFPTAFGVAKIGTVIVSVNRYAVMPVGL